MNEQQWQEDIKNFGELAYLMYYFEITSLCGTKTSCNNPITDWFNNPDYTQLRRKQSAALPFDLAAAIAGDEVEYYQAGEWETCRFALIDNNRFCVGFKDDWYSEGIYDKDATLLLRMKHPRRVGVDYSQFEDKA